MTRSPKAPHEVFTTCVRYFPMVALNLLVERNPGEFLFLLRHNAPARGLWYVPGARLVNGETFADAALDILGEETKMKGELVRVFPTLLEEIWPTTDFTEEDWKNYDRASPFIHYVSAVAHVRVPAGSEPQLDSQSEQYQWSTDIPSKHPFQMRYFEELTK